MLRSPISPLTQVCTVQPETGCSEQIKANEEIRSHIWKLPSLFSCSYNSTASAGISCQMAQLKVLALMLLQVFCLAMCERPNALLSGGFSAAAFCEVLWPSNGFDRTQIKQSKLMK